MKQDCYFALFSLNLGRKQNKADRIRSKCRMYSNDSEIK